MIPSQSRECFQLHDWVWYCSFCKFHRKQLSRSSKAHLVVLKRAGYRQAFRNYYTTREIWVELPECNNALYDRSRCSTFTPWPVLFEQFDRSLQHLLRLAIISHAPTSMLPDVFVYGSVFGNYPPDMFVHSVKRLATYLPITREQLNWKRKRKERQPLNCILRNAKGLSSAYKCSTTARKPAQREDRSWVECSLRVEIWAEAPWGLPLERRVPMQHAEWCDHLATIEQRYNRDYQNPVRKSGVFFNMQPDILIKMLGWCCIMSQYVVTIPWLPDPAPLCTNHSLSSYLLVSKNLLFTTELKTVIPLHVRTYQFPGPQFATPGWTCKETAKKNDSPTGNRTPVSRAWYRWWQAEIMTTRLIGC